MLNALISHKEQTAVLALPMDRLSLQHELAQIGVRQRLADIPISDEKEQDTQVKLYADSDIGNHLLLLFSEQDTLADVNTVCFAMEKSDESVKEELEQNLLYDQYADTVELLRDIRDMTDQLGQIEMSFFCPLDGNIEDCEYGGTTPVGNLYLKSCEWDIRELLEMEQSSPEDEMAQFFNDDDDIKKKLVSAVWTVDEYKGRLYGRIDCRFKEELTADETEIFKGWLLGQCADGFGEGLEQRGIKTEDGEIYVSFWNNSDSYFMENETAFQQRLTDSQHLENMHLGGM